MVLKKYIGIPSYLKNKENLKNVTTYIDNTGGGDFKSDGTVPMAGDIEMSGTYTLKDLRIPIEDTEAAPKIYVDDRVITSATAPLDLTNQVLSINAADTVNAGVTKIITDIGDVTSTDGAACPKYVNDLIDKREINPNVLEDAYILPSVNVDIAAGGSVTVDGITIPDATRVLLANQTNTAENGIYLSNDSGAWSRAADADTTEKLFKAQVTVSNVKNGLFLCNIAKDITLDVDPVSFIQLYNLDLNIIAVTKYDSTRVYNVGDIISYNGALWLVRIEGTVNITPSLDSDNYVPISPRQLPERTVVSTDGSDIKGLSEPWKTIQAPINGYAGNVTIDINRGLYPESVSMDFDNTTLNAEANIGFSETSITGNLSLPAGVGSTKLHGLKIENTDTGTSPSINIQGGNLGNNSFENCSILPATNSQSVYISGAWEGLNVFSFCDFNGGEFVIEGAPVNDPTIFIYSSIRELNVRVKADCTVRIVGCDKVNIVEHTAGNLFIEGCKRITGLTSTATTGLIDITYTTTRLEGSNSYAPINKTGTCPLYFDHVTFDPTIQKDIAGSAVNITPKHPRDLISAKGCVYFNLTNDTGYAMSLTVGSGTDPSMRLRNMPDVFDTGFDILAEIEESETGWITEQGGENYFTVKEGESGKYEFTFSCWRTEKNFGFSANNEKNALGVGLQIKNNTILPTFSGTEKTDEIFWTGTVDENSSPGGVVRTGLGSSVVLLDLEEGNVVTPVFYNEESSSISNEVFNVIFKVRKINV